MKFHLLDIEWMPDKSIYGNERYDYINLIVFQIEDADEYPASLLSIGWWEGIFFFDILFSDWISRKISEIKES